MERTTKGLPKEERRSWRFWLAWSGALVLGATLLLAAWGKALDPNAFAEQITAEGLDFLVPAPWLGWLVVVAEVVLGLALILGLRAKGVLVPTGLLITVFVFLTSRAYYRWLHGIEVEGSECGCFGNLVSRTPAEAFWQDLLLLVPPYALCWLYPTASAWARRARWIAVLAAGVAAGIFTYVSPQLAIDDLATRLAPDVRIADLCAGSTRTDAERVCLDLLIPELESGRHVVVLEALDSDALESVLDDLNALVGVDDLGVWLVTDANQEELQMFYWEWGPLFEVREAPVSLLRPLYRTLPRSFLVEDGVVTATWSGWPGFTLWADEV